MTSEREKREFSHFFAAIVRERKVKCKKKKTADMGRFSLFYPDNQASGPAYAHLD